VKARAEAVFAVALAAFVSAFFLLPWITEVPCFRSFIRSLQ
jgi:hypothetical protein